MSRHKDSHHLTVRDISAAQRQDLISRLSVLHLLEHSISKGAATEHVWIDLLNEFLPPRYRASSAFVLDHHGARSDQIDIAILDAHYAPTYFGPSIGRHLPAEAIHAVFEVKQLLNNHLLADAAAKAASVRRLRRTSNRVPFAGGRYPPKQPFPVLAGVLALESSWPKNFAAKARYYLRRFDTDHRLDLGCSLRHGAFETLPSRPGAHVTGPEESLQFFLARLFDRLQAQGNPPALNIMKFNPNLLPLTYI
jgi:hypothetical protein